MKEIRIVSLIPSATEVVYLLGLEDFLVGRSLDSDYPSDALAKPVVSDTVIDTTRSSREIDEIVRASVHTGRSLFHIDQELLQELGPTLILTQELCKVCAPAFHEVQTSARILNGPSTVLSLEPSSLEDVLENIQLVGEHRERQEEAERQIRTFWWWLRAALRSPESLRNLRNFMKWGQRPFITLCL